MEVFMTTTSTVSKANGRSSKKGGNRDDREVAESIGGTQGFDRQGSVMGSEPHHASARMVAGTPAEKMISRHRECEILLFLRNDGGGP